MLNRGITSVLLLVLSLAGVGIFITRISNETNVSRASVTGAENWPAFVMTYREEGHIGFITDGKPGTQVYEFTYNGSQDWKLTVLDSTKYDNIGSWRVYDGKTVTTFQSANNYTDTVDVSGDNGVYAADQWLTPLYILSLQTKPNAIKQDNSEPGIDTIVLTEERSCTDEIPLTETQKELGVKECSPDQEMRVFTREVTYTSDHLIPMMIIDQIDGVSVYTVTVETMVFPGE